MYTVESLHLFVRHVEVSFLLRWVHDDADEYSFSYRDVCVFQLSVHEPSWLEIVIFKLGVEDKEIPTLVVDGLAQLTIQVLAEVFAAEPKFDATSQAFYQSINA